MLRKTRGIQDVLILLKESYLCSSDFESLPIDPWKNVLDKGRVVFDVGLLELRVLEMEWE